MFYYAVTIRHEQSEKHHFQVTNANLFHFTSIFREKINFHYVYYSISCFAVVFLRLATDAIEPETGEKRRTSF